MLSLFTRPRSILVVESDGYRLRGAIVRARGGEIVVQRSAASDSPLPAEGLRQLLGQFGRTGLPKRAILLSHQAVPAVLELPVDPAQPRPPAQMCEMIRWELEAYLAQTPSSRPLGEILVGRGYLKYDDVARLLEQQACRESCGEGRVRLGDLAVQMNLITANQRDECVAMQEGFTDLPDDDCVCGWQAAAQPSSTLSGQFRWLACGTGKTIRDRWARGFSEAGLELTAIYPLVGFSAAALNGCGSADPTAVIDLQPGMVCATRLDDGEIESIHMHYLSGAPLSAEACMQAVGRTPVSHLWLSGRTCMVPELAGELADRFGLDSQTIPVEASDRESTGSREDSLAPLVAAARHCLLADPHAACIPARERAAPLWKRPLAHTACLVLVFVLALAGVDWFARAALQEAAVAHTAALGEYDQWDIDRERLEGRIRTVERMQQERETRQQELAHTRAKIDFLETALSERERFVLELLQAVAASTSEEVVVDSIREEDRAVHVVGWSLSQDAAQKFVRAVAAAAPRWGLSVRDDPIQEDQGRLGLSGYGIDIRMSAATRLAAEEGE